jgi:alpha-D-xyloside xylohydrolase
MLLDRKFTLVLPDGTTRTIDYNGNQIELKL